jgi:hypothetical protein
MLDPLENPQSSQDEYQLRRFREYVAALFAAIFIVATIAMIIFAFVNSADAEANARMKDLLLIVLPYTGVVLGYYFNRVTTETRVEKAENVAQNAMASAQSATLERQQAREEAEAVSQEAEKWKSSVAELYPLSKQIVSELESAPGPLEELSGSAEALRSQADEIYKTRVALESALERARQLLETK